MKDMSAKHIQGNLVDFDQAKYIAHQCNCVTNKSAGLAKSVFSRFPYADIYSGRTAHGKPGTIIVKGNGKNNRFIINMLGQFYPGPSRYSNNNKDGYQARQAYFTQCLLEVAKIPQLESIAFPYKIGCGMAGDDWDFYLNRLIQFNQMLPNIIVYIVELTN